MFIQANRGGSFGASPLLNGNSLLGAAGFGAPGPVGLGDGFSGDLFGAGPGMGFQNPMLGLNSFNGSGNLLAMMGAMTALEGLMGSQGMSGPGLGGSPEGMGGMGGCQQCQEGQGQQGTIDLQPGQTFTTPGGASITWTIGGGKHNNRSTVDINEPGGGQQHQEMGGCEEGGRAFGAGQESFAGVAAVAGPGFAAAVAVAGTMGGGPAGHACGCQCQQNAKPRHTQVYGDPHIKHPNGSKSDFKRPNAMFTLQDGTRVLMCAQSAHSQVKRVQVILPGAKPNWNGIDPAKTSVMQDNGKGHFNDVGRADKLMAGGFQGFR